MPELPEVESIKRTLEKNILKKRILDAKIFWPSAVISVPGEDFVELLKDKIIDGLSRRGKYLLLHLDNNYTLIVHFRMTGRLVYYKEKTTVDKHTHVVICLEQGELHYSDIRKFGRIQIVSTENIHDVPFLAKLGPEPLDESFNFILLGQQLAKKKSSIKAALLDQTVLAGLGNIYTDEALFKAGVLPQRNIESLKVSEIILLYDSICEVLKEGIKAGGTSFRDYRDANGNKGLFQESLMVYGRAGQACKVCGQKLTKAKVAGRTTVYCLGCQK
ncbi:MAG: bifunctional DNA-formamidopyrimidine glycosylase/DNA-(apurinic or apyrimidinic site) lyase [Peptococcaceae bacterium]|jgi:formamidopyrimidine-DNA glycosylase|nr:bifunctional DNA-formamidopyrimidine glycosylase/DNA-(apurinic or apyrimidinic site) lyase [Peptococcaceae bacterium]